ARRGAPDHLCNIRAKGAGHGDRARWASPPPADIHRWAISPEGSSYLNRWQLHLSGKPDNPVRRGRAESDAEDGRHLESRVAPNLVLVDARDQGTTRNVRMSPRGGVGTRSESGGIEDARPAGE